ncbi:hypothetical protein I4U23_010528 [Adineta vaga]|nr:hypothetical protein I4U23_010528 [Adineta vaga]
MQIGCCNQSKLTAIMPPLSEEVMMDQDFDKSASVNLLGQTSSFGNYNQIINTTSTNINPVTITVDNGESSSSKSKENRLFYFSLKTVLYFFFIILLLLTIMFVLLLLLSKFIVKTNSMDLQKNYENLLIEQKRKDEIMFQMRKQIENASIEQQNHKSNLLIFLGQQFGDSNEKSFDDSLRSDFISSYFLNGIYAQDDGHGFESYQFFYLSPHDDRSVIDSNRHGNQTVDFRYKFYFSKNEKINKVEGRLVKKDIPLPNGTNRSMTIITGLRFFSNEHRASPSYHYELGEEFSEEHKGYTLGYVTGRSAEYLEQVQFVWYRTLSQNSDED